MNVQPVGVSTPIHRMLETKDNEVDGLTALFTNLNLSSRLQECVHYVRGFSVIDTSVIVLLRGINAVSKLCRPLFNDESLRTLKQQERDEEIALLKAKLASKSVCLTFCTVARNYADSVLPSIVADLLGTVPAVVENFVHYNVGVRVPYGLGYGIRYVNYQVDRRTDYRAMVVDSVFGKMFQRAYCAFRTRASSYVLDRSVTAMWVDFEHVFLSACSKVDETEKALIEEARHIIPAGAPTTPKKVAAVLEALALVLSGQDELEAHIKSLGEYLDSGDAFIARLEWHKRKGTLPPGVPDPTKVRLTRENLPAELDVALYGYLNRLSELLLDRQAPRSMKEGFSGFLYWLEGKDFLKKMVSSVAAELGIKQLVDPDLFTVLLLTVFGVETMELERDKFGRNTRLPILKTGQKMVREALKLKSDAISIHAIFTQADLTCAPGNVDAILQRKEAKELLKKFISEMIREAIKGDQREAPSVFKAAKASANSIPVVGYATRGLDILIRGIFHSLQYCFSGVSGQESFFSWMAKNLTGTDVYDYLAERILALIHHPSWRITLLQLVDTLVNVLTVADYNKDVSEEEMKQNFKIITSFLFDHLTGDALKGKVGDWARYFTGEKAFNSFRERVQPGAVAILEKGIPLVLPTIKELLLYERVHGYYRGRGVQFAGDSKFWECFVREYLNQIVACSVTEREEGKYSLAQAPLRARVRAEAVDKFVLLDVRALLEELSKAPDDHRIPEVVSNVVNGGFAIIENYRP